MLPACPGGVWWREVGGRWGWRQGSEQKNKKKTDAHCLFRDLFLCSVWLWPWLGPESCSFLICSNIINTGLIFFITSIDAVFITSLKLNKPLQSDFTHIEQIGNESQIFLFCNNSGETLPGFSSHLLSKQTHTRCDRRLRQQVCWTRPVWTTVKPNLITNSVHSQARGTAAAQQCKNSLKGPFVSSQINHLSLTDRCCTVLIYNNRRHHSVTRWKRVRWDQPLSPFPITVSGLRASMQLLLNGLAEWSEHMVLLPVGLTEQTTGRPAARRKDPWHI